METQNHISGIIYVLQILKYLQPSLIATVKITRIKSCEGFNSDLVKLREF